MEMELEQVRLALTDDPAVLKILKQRKQFQKDRDGEYVPVCFNSAELRFRPKQSIVLGRTVASALLRSSQIIVGDDISGEITPWLETLEDFSLNAGGTSSSYKCEFCGADSKSYESMRTLARHVASQHSDELGTGDPAIELKSAPTPAAPVPPKLLNKSLSPKEPSEE